MKKSTNIAALKELVNNNALERVELYTRGVQAYNIAEGEEYAVVIAYAKQGGRYYFIDREGRRFLVSRYDRTEKAYIMIPDPVESVYRYAVTVTRYTV